MSNTKTGTEKKTYELRALRDHGCYKKGEKINTIRTDRPSGYGDGYYTALVAAGAA
jgi:hypothetical protein